MKKYFAVETEEEVKFGDVLHLTCVKDVEDGKVTIEKEVEFNEDTLDLFMELGIVEEEEEDTNDELLDFGDDYPCAALNEMIEDFEALEKRVDTLEELAKGTHQEVMKLVNTLIKEEEAKKPKNASSKK